MQKLISCRLNTIFTGRLKAVLKSCPRHVHHLPRAKFAVMVHPL
jgi:hypothetical protein